MKTPWLVNKRWTSANLRWSDKRKKNIPGGRRQILAGGERWTNVGNFPPLEFLGLLLGEAASQQAAVGYLRILVLEYILYLMS